MNHKNAQTNPSHRVLGGASANRKMAACIGIALSLAACSLSKPGAADIEPYVMDEFGKCFLWTISDVRKVDGIEEGNAYRVDFTAKLTLKETPEQAVRSYAQHQQDPSNASCYKYDSLLALMPSDEMIAKAMESKTVPPLLWAKQYEVTGAGILVKSEKGWRLSGDIQSAINPI